MSAVDDASPCFLCSSEVIEQKGYIAEADTANPASSVFCAHGSGFVVPWNEVEEYMHLEAVLLDDGTLSGYSEVISQ